jgi:hypothetical protein
VETRTILDSLPSPRLSIGFLSTSNACYMSLFFLRVGACFKKLRCAAVSDRHALHHAKWPKSGLDQLTSHGRESSYTWRIVNL